MSQVRNPNRVQRSKINLRPDQAKRFNAMGPRKHIVMRKILDAHFKMTDEMQKMTQVEV